LLAVVDTGVHLDIEVKCEGIEPEILAVIGDRSRSSWAISSFNWPVLRTFRALAPDIELWVLSNSVSDDAVAAAKELGATTLAIRTQSLNQKSVARAAHAGFRIMAWTANSIEECQRLQQLGVHAVCTDDPARILAALS
jgi:glycerophosphoryl diester phosphodiesterase